MAARHIGGVGRVQTQAFAELSCQMYTLISHTLPSLTHTEILMARKEGELLDKQ